MKINVCIAKARYKAYRLASLLTLGKKRGGAIGSHLCRDIIEGSAGASIGGHIEATLPLRDAYVQKYPFQNDFPGFFPRTEAFTARSIYKLRDVVISPATGAMWLPDGTYLQQSTGSVPRSFAGAVLTDTLSGFTPVHEENPVVPMANPSYYHWHIESLPQILHARSHVAEIKLAGVKPLHGYIKASLDFLDLTEKLDIIHSDTPIRVKHTVLVPRWVNGGFVPQEDVDILRSEVVPRLKINANRTRKIYISRSKSTHRPLENEHELEDILKKRGFEVLYFENLSFPEQMQTIAEASEIIAPHGAGLANMIAGQPGLRITEILSPNWMNTCHAKLAVQLGFTYSYSLAERASSGVCVSEEFIQKAGLS